MITIVDPFTQAELSTALKQVFREVADFFAQIPARQFFEHSSEAWSPAENLVHLSKSVSPVAKAMKFPKLLSAVVFGTSNGSSRRLAQIKEAYLLELAHGAQATGRFVPTVEMAPADIEQAKNTVLAKWSETGDKLLAVLREWAETDLDRFQLPHPILGQVTVREMLFFTLYHSQHHVNDVQA
jgi:uncharacterized damage-inducible protein DinB